MNPLMNRLATVVQLDSDEKRRPIAEAHPLNIAPWSCTLAGRFHSYAAPEPVPFVLQNEGPTLLLLHEGDRPALQRSLNLEDWLQANDRRYLLLYSGGWGWNLCEREPILSATAGTIPPDLWRNRWTAMPWDSLNSLARPACWLLQRFPLAGMCAPFLTWREDAIREQLGDEVGVDLGVFDERLRNRLLVNTILNHQLNYDGAHPLSPDQRLTGLLASADRLWVVEGMARLLRASRVAARIERVLKSLEVLVGRPPTANHLNDSDQSRWIWTVEIIEDICKEPLG